MWLIYLYAIVIASIQPTHASVDCMLLGMKESLLIIFLVFRISDMWFAEDRLVRAFGFSPNFP